MKTIHLNIDNDNIALITLNNPPNNALTLKVFQELIQILYTCQNNTKIKAIILTGNFNNKFSQGLDLSIFQKADYHQISKYAYEAHHSLYSILESGEKPTICAINGLCIGGGCEIALACNYRISSTNKKGDQSLIGLPETQLGLIPGGGGTQRLFRLIGIEKALELILNAKLISFHDALKLGLINEIVDDKDLIKIAKLRALDILENKIERCKALKLDKVFEENESKEELIEKCERYKNGIEPEYEHLKLCIDAMIEGIRHGSEMGLLKEYDCFLKCLKLTIHKALLHVFVSERQTKNLSFIDFKKEKSVYKYEKIKNILVIGAGFMGSNIAATLSKYNYKVYLNDLNNEKLHNTISELNKLFRNVIAIENINNLNDNIDLIIEAIDENITLKNNLFKNLINFKENVIYATNSSTIPIEKILPESKLENGIGMHFFFPLEKVKVIEVVITTKTSNLTIYKVMELIEQIQKIPIIVKSSLGYALNRCILPLFYNCIFLMENINSIIYIDDILSKKFKISPSFKVMDRVGLDVLYNCFQYLYYNDSDNDNDNDNDNVLQMFKSLEFLINRNELGLKSNFKKGFYEYDNENKRIRENQALIQYLKEEQSKSDDTLKNHILIKNLLKEEEELIHFILFPMINEGCRILEEGIIEKASDLDIGCIMANGFPRHLGGPFFWTSYILTPNYVYDKLIKMAKNIKNNNNKMMMMREEIFRPCKLLENWSKSKDKDYIYKIRNRMRNDSKL